MQRRTLLAALSVAAGSAGCLAVEPPQGPARDDSPPGDDTGPADDGGPADGTDPDDEPDRGNGVGSAAITTTGSDCGGPAVDHVHVLVRDGRIVLDGTIPAPTPCYAATLVSAAVDDREIALTIGVASTLDGDESCVQCHGKVEYSSELTLDGDVAVDSIVVTHDTGRIHREALPDGEHAGRVSTETIETACANQLGEESVTVREHAQGYRLDGVRPAPNPCHAATIQAFEQQGERVRLVVGLEDTVPPEEGCIECEGSVRYEIALRPDDLATVTELVVEHEGAGTHEFTTEEADDGAIADDAG